MILHGDNRDLLRVLEPDSLLNRVVHGDFLQNNLPDKSVQLIIADPPYFEVKGAFDFIWPTFNDYLADVERWAKECKRVLADNGTLLWWGHAKRIAYSQVILDRYFELENSITWVKPDSMQYQYYSVDSARIFTPNNERLLMYSNETDGTGYEVVLEEKIKPRHPFALYLQKEFARAGVSNREIAALFPSATGGLTGCVSNWLNGDNTITEPQYQKIREYLGGDYLQREYEELRREYEELRREYEELRREYEELRRPFNNTRKLTDCMTFSQEANVSRRYAHPTAKSETMAGHLINATTRPNDMVLIPFAGSGTECVAALKTGRRFVGYEIKAEYVSIAEARVAAVPDSLFAEAV